jgi:hypothetical protein
MIDFGKQRSLSLLDHVRCGHTQMTDDIADKVVLILLSQVVPLHAYNIFSCIADERQNALTKILGQAKSISETVERYLTAPPI